MKSVSSIFNINKNFVYIKRLVIICVKFNLKVMVLVEILVMYI